MALSFPNASRSWDQAKQCVSFWGHDSMLEVAFEVEDQAIHIICPTALRNEESLLNAFDANRSRIEKIAGQMYGRQRRSYLRLSAADF